MADNTEKKAAAVRVLTSQQISANYVNKQIRKFT